MTSIYLAAICLGLHVQFSNGCTLPSYLLNADWTSSRYGMLTVNATTLGSITVGSYGNYYFDCFLNTGTKYALRSTEVKNILSVDQYFYLCFDFRYQSNDQYIYYLQTSTESAANNERVKIIAATTTPTISDVCDFQQPNHRYALLTKDGNYTNTKITCPSWISGDFNYTASGCTETSTTTCLDNSILTSNLTACATDFTGESSAEYWCQYHTTIGSVNYLTVNIGSAILCLAAETNGTGLAIIYDGAFPSDCPETDTPSTTSNTKLLFALNYIAPCPMPSTVASTIETTNATTVIPTTSVAPQRSSAHRSALNAILPLFVLVSAFSQAL